MNCRSSYGVQALRGHLGPPQPESCSQKKQSARSETTGHRDRQQQVIFGCKIGSGGADRDRGTDTHYGEGPSGANGSTSARSGDEWSQYEGHERKLEGAESEHQDQKTSACKGYLKTRVGDIECREDRETQSGPRDHGPPYRLCFLRRARLRGRRFGPEHRQYIVANSAQARSE